MGGWTPPVNGSVRIMSSDRGSEGRPHTIWDALSRAAEEFRAAAVDSPQLTAEVLLGWVLCWERPHILAHLHDPLTADAWERFQILAQRRASGEPLQYLIGEREFYGLSFRVTPAVLIPRPETEVLVEKALDLGRKREGIVRFADVGTGSGCIAVSFTHELPRACGWATDISTEALAVARYNAAKFGVSQSIKMVCSDLLGCFSPRPIFDLILSNPPYVAASAAGDLPGLVRDHEPAVALFGGDSGLDVHRRLIPQAALRLVEGGHLLLEVGAGQASEIQEMIRSAGLDLDQTVEDLQGIPRCIVARRGAAKDREPRLPSIGQAIFSLRR
jgi:release factor glutamine methyltransferase